MTRKVSMIGLALALLATPVMAQNPPIIINPTTPVPYPFTSAGAMQPQLSVTTGAVVTLTVPSGTLYAIVCVRSAAASAINYSYDGSTPTTTAAGNGLQLAAGQCVSIQGIALLNSFKMIAATATTAVDIGYTK